MANPRALRQARKARSNSEAQLNITSMMDMFTIILVFLLKTFSTEGQLITPATGLVLPTSSIERTAKQALAIQISNNSVAVEDNVVISPQEYQKVLQQKEFMIEKLSEVLMRYAEEAKKAAEMFGKEFSGEITIQGDVEVPYHVLTRIMYTCGQSGYPVMNLIVYREE